MELIDVRLSPWPTPAPECVQCVVATALTGLDACYHHHPSTLMQEGVTENLHGARLWSIWVRVHHCEFARPERYMDSAGVASTDALLQG